MPLRHHFELRETIATIIADREEDIRTACRGLEEARQDIERYILADPFFRTSFDPVPVFSTSPIITGMARAAELTGVGPMAAVAGAVAGFAIEKVAQQGSPFCIIDNGGDIALVSDRQVRIGLYSGDSALSGKYAFLLNPQGGIYGVCTSSATVGHSMSLGTADSVTVFGSDPVLADATATAVCNELTPEEQSCLENIGDGIDGIFAVFKDTCIIWGDIPAIVPAKVNEELITAGHLII
jgi:ApbE superfamily uncharacterized protein (UPF0280 family)